VRKVREGRWRHDRQDGAHRGQHHARRAGRQNGWCLMPRRPARLTQADVARAIRAAMQAGADHVEVRLDGTIVVILVPDAGLNLPDPLAATKEIVL
jgi:hypothetical protein